MFGCNDPFMLSIEAFDDADVLNTEQILYKSCRNICIRTGNVQSHIQQIKLINKDKHVNTYFPLLSSRTKFAKERTAILANERWLFPQRRTD